jgi:hypothetical protein
VPELVEVVITGTFGATEEGRTGAKKTPPSEGDEEVSWAWLLLSGEYSVGFPVAKEACDSRTKIAPFDASCTGPVLKNFVPVRTSLSSMMYFGTILKVVAGTWHTIVLIDKAGKL